MKVSDIQAVGFSSESALVGAGSHKALFKDIIQSDKITHDDMRNMAKTFFNTDVASNLFCFRSGGPYGLVMGISNIGITTGEDGVLTDIFLHLTDMSMDTSLSMTISVKDLDEMFKPFIPVRLVRA